jgi:rhodanese-related sulfurtransferase
MDAMTVKKRLDEGSAVLIDVREPHEHAREHIEGAKLVPLSRFQAENFAGF